MKSGLHKLSCMMVVFLIFSAQYSQAQVESKDIKDIINQFKKNPGSHARKEITVGKTNYTLLPYVGYAPANGFVLGGAMSIVHLFGKPPTSLSSGMITCQVTSKKQFITNARTKIYLRDNKWFLQGDWRLLIFSQTTYGLGIQSSVDSKPQFYINNLEETTGTWGDPMRYNQIRFYEEASRELGNSSFYIGMGVALDHLFDINDERLDTIPDSPDYYITSHYEYSLKNNFNPLHYGNYGLKFTVLTDTRDNIANCYKGYFASASMIYNAKLSDNSQQSTQLLYEAMYYLRLSSRNPAHILAFWSWGSFIMQGTVPYLVLPSIGWDTFNRSGRGFIQGRYRGLNMMYNEAEYRFQVSKNGLFGGVLFVNATHSSDYYQKLFEKVAIGAGAGIRIKFDKLSRTNLGVDYGIGSDRSSGIYFNLQETF